MKLIQGGKMEGGAHQAPPVTEAFEDTLSFVLLTLADESYAIDVTKIKGIVRVPAITWVPGCIQPVRGVVNLRGVVVPVVDLAVALALEPVEEKDESRIVVIDGKAESVGMLVSGVNEVANISSATLKPPMQTLNVKQRLLVQAQFNHGDNLVGVLDIDRVIEEVRKR
jgi:purine-binding chemotaxis protein CheW